MKIAQRFNAGYQQRTPSSKVPEGRLKIAPHLWIQLLSYPEGILACSPRLAPEASERRGPTLGTRTHPQFLPGTGCGNNPQPQTYRSSHSMPTPRPLPHDRPLRKTTPHQTPYPPTRPSRPPPAPTPAHKAATSDSSAPRPAPDPAPAPTPQEFPASFLQAAAWFHVRPCQSVFVQVRPCRLSSGPRIPDPLSRHVPPHLQHSTVMP